MKTTISTLFVILLSFHFLFAQTNTTVKDGNWNSASTWDNGVPSWGNNAVINHDINLNANVDLGAGYLLINSGASLIQSGNSDISVSDNAGSFRNHGSVTARTLQGSGTFENTGTLTLTNKLSINNPANFNNSGDITISNNISLWTDGNFINDGTIDAGGNLSSDATNITNNGSFSFAKYSGEAVIDNYGTMSLSRIDNMYSSGQLINHENCVIDISGYVKFWNNTKLINDGNITISGTNNSDIGGSLFTNRGTFIVNGGKTTVCQTNNTGYLKFYDLASSESINNNDTLLVTNDVNTFSSSSFVFTNQDKSYFEIGNNFLQWNGDFTNYGFVNCKGNFHWGGSTGAKNYSIMVTKGKFQNEADFLNNGAVYCIGSDDFINDWGSSLKSTSCGHVNVACNNFNNKTSVTGNINILGNRIGSGSYSPSVTANPYCPCDLGITYYSRDDGNWDDYNLCSGPKCVWSIEQIKPDPVYEYPKSYGNVIIDNNTIEIDAACDQPLACDDLTLNPLGNLTIESSKALTANGDFLIKSPLNDGATGSLIDNGTFTVNGTNTVQRYFTGTKWHYLCFPVASVPRNTFTAQNFYYYDETTHDWWSSDDIYGTMGWTNPTSANLSDEMRGYIYYYYSTMLEYTGNLNTGTKQIDLSYTDTPADDVFDGWNLIGNPYPSAIDWHLVNKTDITDNCVYYYLDDDGTAPFYSNYKYYIDGSSGSPYPGIALNRGSRYIPAMQGFFVKRNQMVVSQFLQFDNSVRVHSSQDFYKNDEVHPDLLRLQVKRSDYIDETIIRFIPEATQKYDPEFDALKKFLYGSNFAQLYSIINQGNDKDLSVNTLADYHGTIVKLGFKTDNSGEHTISATEINFDEDIDIFLKDYQIGAKINLTETPEYTFSSGVGNFPNRFKLFFFNKNEDIESSDLSNEKIISSINEISFVTDGKAEIFIYSIDGKLVKHFFDNTTFVKVNINTSGVYIAKMITGNKLYTQKIIIQN